MPGAEAAPDIYTIIKEERKMSLSSIGGYNAYAQQYAANNTPTQTEIAKAMVHEVRSQIANGTIADVGELGDTVSISNGARMALAALLALQKNREAENSEAGAQPQPQTEPPKEERMDVVQKRTEAIMRAYFQ